MTNEFRKLIASSSNLQLLEYLKNNGLPADDKEITLIFRKLKGKKNGEYPVTWGHLREYLPELDEHFGVERYVSLHREYNLCGDMYIAIRDSGMPEIDKQFLFFVYQIG